MEKMNIDGIDYEIRNYYFHRDLYRIQKGVDEKQQYPYGHYGYVVAVTALNKETNEICVGFSFMRPHYPFSKQEKAFFRTLALNRALSRNGYKAKFSGSSKVHVVEFFNLLPKNRRAGFARRMTIYVDERDYIKDNIL